MLGISLLMRSIIEKISSHLISNLMLFIKIHIKQDISMKISSKLSNTAETKNRFNTYHVLILKEHTQETKKSIRHGITTLKLTTIPIF